MSGVKFNWLGKCSEHAVDTNNNHDTAEITVGYRSGPRRSKSRSSATSASTTKSCPISISAATSAHSGASHKATDCDNVSLKRQNSALIVRGCASDGSDNSGDDDEIHDTKVEKRVAIVKRRDSFNEGLIRRCNRINRVDGEDTIMARYQISSCLGQGNFAVVSRCVDNNDQTVWAMKEVEVAQLNGAAYCIENEAALMFLCDHVNIVHLREVFLTPSTYYLIMEAVDNGDLFDAIKGEGPFSEPMVASMIHDSASALKYLHKRKIAHRDVKPENLLLTGDYRLKLADFGLACVVQGSLYRVCGTPTYVAPEVLSETGYGVPVDIWSLGIIMHILFCGYAPFRSTDREQLFEQIKVGALEFENDTAWENVSTAVATGSSRGSVDSGTKKKRSTERLADTETETTRALTTSPSGASASGDRSAISGDKGTAAASRRQVAPLTVHLPPHPLRGPPGGATSSVILADPNMDVIEAEIDVDSALSDVPPHEIIGQSADRISGGTIERDASVGGSGVQAGSRAGGSAAPKPPSKEPVMIRGTGNLTLFGLSSRFCTDFPGPLVGRLAPEEFRATMRRINGVLRKTMPANGRWLVAGCFLCCCTCACSLWPVLCLNRRTIHALEKNLDWENSHLYNKLGLHWRLAKRRCDSSNMTEYVLLIEFLPRAPLLIPD